RFTLDDVASVARVPFEGVVAIAHPRDVVALEPAERVVSVPAEQRVVALAAEKRVVTGASVDCESDRLSRKHRRRGVVIALQAVDDELVARLSVLNSDQRSQARDR